MSLEITSSQIIIHNKDGVPKFNSDQTLIHQTGYQMGYGALGGGWLNSGKSVAPPTFIANRHYLTIDDDDIIVLKLMLLGVPGQGTIGEHITRIDLSANMGIPLDLWAREYPFYHMAVTSEWITGYVNKELIFFSVAETETSSVNIGTGSPTNGKYLDARAFRYELKVFKYL